MNETDAGGSIRRTNGLLQVHGRGVLDCGEKLVPFIMRIPAADSRAFIRRLENRAKGIGISDWFVPHETYFLVANDSEVVGVSNLRF
jgi:predicted acetyltransferase